MTDENKTPRPEESAPAGGTDPKPDFFTSQTKKVQRGHTFSGDVPTGTKRPSSEKGTFAGATLPTGVTGERTEQRRGERPLAETEEWRRIGEGPVIDVAFEKMRLLLVCCICIPVLLFAYWPSLLAIVNTWYKVQDYTHGFLVLPLVVYFLWVRIDTYPGTSKKLEWTALILILMSCAARYFASKQYMDAVEQWSILLWVLGVVWLFYGNRSFLWALPSLLFLCFLFPLPFTIEIQFRRMLQEVAANFAAFLLQALGEPAVNIKTTIRLGINEIGVEAACSGIRFMISFLAIAFGTALLLRRPWWQNIVLFAGVIPIALFVNACRIVVTSLLIAHQSSFLERFTGPHQSVGVLADNIAGYFAISLAFFLFAVFVWYLTRVFRKVKYSGV